MSKKEAKLKGVMDRNQVVIYLEELINGLKSGKICVQQGEDFVTLCPEQMIDVEVQASVKKGKEKLEMELAWRREDVPWDIKDMLITSCEPEITGQNRDMDAAELPEVSGSSMKTLAADTRPSENAPEAFKAGNLKDEGGKTKTGKMAK